MNNILWFREISDSNINEVGQKALSISKLYNNNITVPNGFCIPYEVFNQFLEETKIKEKIEEVSLNLDNTNLNSLYSVSERIQNLILNTNIPHKIRTQITESYENINVDIDVFKMAGKNALEIIKAGRETTYVCLKTSHLNNNLEIQSNMLNIKGKEEIVKALQKCWASLFSPNSINLKIKNNTPVSDFKTAVIVQKMIDSEKAGIICTINPETSNKNEIIIEACFGQGEVMTTGSIIPDKYVINKNTKEITEKTINKQDFMLTKDDSIGKNIKKNIFNNEEQKLNDQEIQKVISYALQIESIYKQPQEIEFCVNKDKIYILQSKPILTPEIKTAEDPIQVENKKEQDIILKGLNASLGIRTGQINIIKNSDELNNIKENQIIVLKSYNSINLNLLDSEKLRKLNGVITDSDTLDSPLARIARDFGIPCIVNTLEATKLLKQNQLVTIDGNTGVVYEEINKKIDNRLTDYYETATEVKVLINSNEIIPDSEKHDGIGILKISSEELYLTVEKEQFADKISQEIESKIEHFKNKPIWYYVQFLENPEFIKSQFESIKKLQDKGITNIGIAMSSLTDVQQIKEIKKTLKEMKLEPLEEIELGLIIDTPASSILINEFCEEGLDFIIIDLIKLTTTTLNINNEYNERYNENHPSILKQITNIIKTCRKANIETSITGKNINESEFIEFLVKIGLDSIITKPDSVNETKNKIAKTEKKLILKAVREELYNQN